MKATRIRSTTIAALLALLLESACVGTGQSGSQTELIETTKSDATAAEFRAVANNLAIRVPGLIEQTGNRMQTSEPEQHRAALLWKIEATAAFQQALLRADPLGAAVEAWALAIQVQDAVGTGAFHDAFGPQQPIAREGAEAIRRAIDDEYRSIVRKPEDYVRLRDFVTQWAHENPITIPFSTRPSIQPLLAQIASQKELGALEAIGSVSATVTDLSTKLDLYAASIPKSLRWQSELAALDAARSDTGQLALATLRSANEVLGRADTVLSPEAMKELSGAAAVSLHRETLDVLGDLERQRIDAFERLVKERLAVLEALNTQRIATLTDLDAKIDRALAESETAADRTLLRAGVGVGGLIILAALLAWLVGLSGVFRRAPPA